jgi:superfamily II helicase
MNKECNCDNLDQDVSGYTCYKCYERENEMNKVIIDMAWVAQQPENTRGRNNRFDNLGVRRMNICQFCGWEIARVDWYHRYNDKLICDNCVMDTMSKRERESNK